MAGTGLVFYQRIVTTCAEALTVSAKEPISCFVVVDSGIPIEPDRPDGRYAIVSALRSKYPGIPLVVLSEYPGKHFYTYVRDHEAYFLDIRKGIDPHSLAYCLSTIAKGKSLELEELSYPEESINALPHSQRIKEAIGSHHKQHPSATPQWSEGELINSVPKPPGMIGPPDRNARVATERQSILIDPEKPIEGETYIENATASSRDPVVNEHSSMLGESPQGMIIEATEVTHPKRVVPEVIPTDTDLAAEIVQEAEPIELVAPRNGKGQSLWGNASNVFSAVFTRLAAGKGEVEQSRGDNEHVAITSGMQVYRPQSSFSFNTSGAFPSKLSIGVFALSRGAGATHTAIDIAEFFAQRGSTALMAYDLSYDIEFADIDERVFTFVPKKEEMNAVIREMHNGYFRYIIYDFGTPLEIFPNGALADISLSPDTLLLLTELQRCDRKVCLSFDASWHASKLNFLEEYHLDSNLVLLSEKSRGMDINDLMNRLYPGIVQRRGRWLRRLTS